MRLAACLILFAVSASARPLDAGAAVLVNSAAPDYVDFRDLIEPYLVHFGVPYTLRDISQEKAFDGLDGFSLIIIGHRGLDPSRRFLTDSREGAIVAAVNKGTGLVSFDGLLRASRARNAGPFFYTQVPKLFGLQDAKAVDAREIVIGADGAHFIADRRPVPRTVKLKSPMSVPGFAPGFGVRVVARAGQWPLVLAAQSGRGRAVLFASYDWVRTSVKGKLYGLDDLVWRSLVWAARKPFVMRGMPKFLALRVDDVSGFGIAANGHLGWMETANRYGLKPWVGVFMDDMREDPEAVRRLAELTKKGLATASIHARRWPSFFFLDEPLTTDDRQTNVAGRPWPDSKMAANWAEAEKFFDGNGIVKGKLVLPHFYEFATNNFEGLRHWGGELVGTVLQPGHGYGTVVPPSGPYLKGEPPRLSSGADPIFIADWLSVPGRPDLDRRFFNFVVEIRDVTGYEWAPSGVPVEEAIRRGVEESRREFDSLLPAVLFTHESDHIRHIKPEDWNRILAGVTDRLEEERPLPVTLDYVAQYMRALNTTRIRRARFDPASSTGSVEFDGESDLPIKFYVYGPDDAPREFEAPVFRGHASVDIRVSYN